MNTSWIKRHEKLPAMDDLPIITTCYEGGKWRTQLWTEYTPRAEHEYTYWTRFRAEPPPRELTQREMDNNAADAMLAEKSKGTQEHSHIPAVVAKEMRKCVVAIRNEGWHPGESIEEMLVQFADKLEGKQ